ADQTKGRMNLSRDYGLPLPTTIVAELLGVPTRDRHRSQRWSNTIVTARPNTWGLLKAMPSLFAFLGYLRKFIKTRRSAPADDLVGALVAAREAGDRLDED